jgi:eukaryotic-like serine/threonine-protein kinase
VDWLVQLVGRLLSEVHAAFPAAVCPGGWAWTTTIVGGLAGLLPMLGAMLVALTRRWTGNRYGGGMVLLFGAIGLIMTAALPWLLFSGTSEVFRGALHGEVGAVGLHRADLATLRQDFCFAPPQTEYLGGARSVREVLVSLSNNRPGVFVGGMLLLAVLPLLATMFVFGQSRLALRRGPRWPSLLLWLPMVLLVVGTSSLSATVVAHLWLGFLPVSVLGMLGVALVGAPRWSVIEHRAAKDGPVTTVPAAAVPAAATPQPPGAREHEPAVHQALGVQPPPRGQPPSGPPPAGWPMGGQPHRAPTTPFGLPQQPPPIRPPVQGPLPETLLRAIGSTDGASAPPEHPEPPTLPASRFQRIRPLGSGGFGTVWLAVDMALDRTVAVKAAKAPDEETERRIRREARALAAVHHPNCVRIYDILTDADGELVIVMEYVPGRSLSAAIEADGRLSDVAAARLWSTLAGALHAAHGKGVLHRDVKPSNIILDEGGYPHLIDFGIARAAGDVTLTAAGMVLGTPDYMAPEVAAGQPANPASDAWQLAATVSYAMAGMPPRGHRDGAIAAMLAAAQGAPCNQLPAHTAHRGLLEQALHPDPARRPSLPDVQAELDRWLAAVTELLQRPPSPAWPTEEPA